MQEAASVSVEVGVGGGRSLLQYRDRYKERERERERQRKLKEREGIYGPVEFKVILGPNNHNKNKKSEAVKADSLTYSL